MRSTTVIIIAALTLSIAVGLSVQLSDGARGGEATAPPASAANAAPAAADLPPPAPPPAHALTAAGLRR